MEISFLGKDGYKIKTKTGSLVAGPEFLTIAHKAGGDDFKITAPGEYEVEGISVFGYKTEESTCYIVQYEDLRILYLGEMTKMLEEKMIAELENIDVVILPVDGASMKDLTELVAKFEPYYVLPYGAETSKFVVEYEHGSRTVKSLNLSKLGLPEDLTEVIVFE